MAIDLIYNLFIIDYHNGHFSTVSWFRVNKKIFSLHWTSICDLIPTTRASGLGSFQVQDYMQDNSIRFNMHNKEYTIEKAKEYINANSLNKKQSKLVTHSNIGNY